MNGLEGRWARPLIALNYLGFYIPFIPVVVLFLLAEVWIAQNSGA